MSRIVSIRKVKNDSLQAEMVGRISKPGQINVLAELNKGDERFNVSGSERRAWFPVTLQWLMEAGMPADKLAKLEALTEGEKMEYIIENPQVAGQSLEIQVNETINPDQFQSANAMKTAKKIDITKDLSPNVQSDFDLTKYVGQKGYFLDKDGNHIFSRTTVQVKSQVKHTFVTGTLVPEQELANYGATLAEPMKVEEKVEA